MKRSHILLPFLSIHCWLLMLFGCQSAPANYITTTTLESTSSPTTLPITPMPNLITPFVQTAETTYPTPSVTTTTLAVVTPTTLSTLSYDEALVTVQTLYETNNGCLLPCWWGITPGKTTWEQTKDLLSPFVSQILEPLVPPSTSLWGVEVYIPGRMTPLYDL